MNGLQKILNGIIRFRAGPIRKDLLEQFARIRDNPNPTAVLFTCMDSRMMMTRIMQAQVGDMFVVRNSGNMIPHAINYGESAYHVSVTTEPAALELAVKRGKIKHVIVCGHADCKAINALYNIHQNPKQFDPESPMDHWLRRHGFISVDKLIQRLASASDCPVKFAVTSANFESFDAIIDSEERYGAEDKLSQINTLQQLENVASHGFLQEFLKSKSVSLHAMWFDVYTGEIYLFSRQHKKFTLIDETSVQMLMDQATQYQA